MYIDPKEFFGDIPITSNDCTIKIEWSWVSVKDSFPIGQKKCLITDMQDICIADFHFEQFVGGHIFDSEVTHWMSLPEPPKE